MSYLAPQGRLLTLAATGQVSLGWPWVEVITACAVIGTGLKRTLEMSIVEKGGVVDDGREGRVWRMVGDWVDLL